MATEPTQPLSLVPASRGFDAAQVNLIKRTIAKDCTNDELALFLEVCRSSGLDPFRRQIYAIVRGSGDKRQMSIQTGIDGYRLLAARTGDLAGIDDPVYDAEETEHPAWARVTVWRWSHDQRVPYTATARWKEYAAVYDGKPSGKWRDMPYLMLGKCAEALALRRAFPAELSGVYTPDEMAQADEVTALPYVEADVTPAGGASASNPLDERIAKALRSQDVLSALTEAGYKSQSDRRDVLAAIIQRFDEEHMTVTVSNLKQALLKYTAPDDLPDSLHDLPVGTRGN